MAFSVEKLEIMGGGKRIDASVKQTSIWIADKSADIRILAKEPIGEEEAPDLLKQVMDRRSEWTKGKKPSLRLTNKQATAFILKYTEE